MKYLFIITLTLSLFDRPLAQSYEPAQPVPAVFLIGDFEEKYFDLSQQHPLAFLSIYDNDIDRAYRGWSELLMDIEDFATETNFDLKGVKLWLNLFFNADGSIANLGYYPKPNSRNIPEDQLSGFFQSFVDSYHFTEEADAGFQHSASASFPTFFHRTAAVTAKGN